MCVRACARRNALHLCTFESSAQLSAACKMCVCLCAFVCVCVQSRPDLTLHSWLGRVVWKSKVTSAFGPLSEIKSNRDGDSVITWKR